MTRTPAGKKKRARKKTAPKISAPGLPAKDSIREVVRFVSPQKVRYTILKTTERDAYDPPGVPSWKANKNRDKE